jgi:GalNAc-alpha-(1->4)-GalNAc-alpha-(1->3)-diNAcBac-PP-undecaprenol alpha-1,4-N-acetyl-D-galactosaminyltransferase
MEAYLISRKLALVISTLASPGGAERVAAALANYWCESGVEVVILTFDEAGSSRFYRVAERVRVISLGGRGNSRNLIHGGISNLRRILAVRSALVDLSPDVVLSFGDTTSTVTLAASRGLAMPVIAADRTSPAHAPITALWRILRDATYRVCDRLIVQTSSARDYYVDRGVRAVDVIPNPVSRSISRKTRPSANTVVAAGRFTREKGFDLLIQAFALVAEVHPSWSLVIHGDGPLRGELERLATEVGLDSRIRLAGNATDLSGQLSGAGLFVLSSHFEGFPNALCEAMAAGIPVIATDCPVGPREIVTDGEDGLLVPPFDVHALATAIDLLIRDGARRDRMGKAATAIVERLSIDRISRMWASSINAALGTGDVCSCMPAGAPRRFE